MKLLSPGHAAADLVPLAERLRYMRLLRFLLVAVAIAVPSLWPESLHVPRPELFVGGAVYLVTTVAFEALWRVIRRRGLLLFGVMLLVDGIFLAWAAYVTGAIRGPLSALIFVHVVAVALLASYRTAVKLALWHSLLTFAVFRLQDTGIVDPVVSDPSLTGVLVFVGMVWFVALATASFSAVNERELLRRRYDLEALASFASALERAQSTSTVARTLVDDVVETFGFPRVLVIGGTETPLTLLAHHRAETGVEHYEAGPESLLQAARETRRTLLVSGIDPKQDGWLAALLPDSRNLALVPLWAEGQCVGVLVAEHGLRSGSRIERRVVTMLERFASQGALALRNAWLLEEMERRASTDGLTGIANRHIFQTTLEREAARAARSGADLSLLMIDLDHFKEVNDTYGHQKGDAVLKSVADILERTCREYDVPARYGGEEFAVVMPGCASSDALAIAERIRREVATEHVTLSLTTSVGVANMPLHATDPESLMFAADAALYEAKRRGRNCSALATLAPATAGAAAGRGTG